MTWDFLSGAHFVGSHPINDITYGVGTRPLTQPRTGTNTIREPASPWSST